MTAPVANFSAYVTFGSAPFDVTFQDLSTNVPTSWLWDFGDGNTSTDQNPVHTYVDVGMRYTVSLTATNADGSNTKTVLNFIVTAHTPATFPCIAYQNLFNDEDVTVVASSEQAGFEHQNAYDYKSWTWWKPNNGDQYLELQFPSARSFNCVALYGHDLGANGAYVEVQFSVDGGTTWLKATPPYAPASTECLYRRFPRVIASRIRLHVVSPTASIIACAFIGLDMELERGCKDQFSPPAYNRQTKTTNVQSQNGVWLGRSLIYQGSAVTINPDFLTEDFIKEDWMPFVEHAEMRPWFLLWDESAHADEASWCYSSGAIPGSIYTSYSLLNATITAVAKLS